MVIDTMLKTMGIGTNQKNWHNWMLTVVNVQFRNNASSVLSSTIVTYSVRGWSKLCFQVCQTDNYNDLTMEEDYMLLPFTMLHPKTNFGVEPPSREFISQGVTHIYGTYRYMQTSIAITLIPFAFKNNGGGESCRKVLLREICKPTWCCKSNFYQKVDTVSCLIVAEINLKYSPNIS